MASIYRQAMGEAFHKLHPRIQERFGYTSEDQIATIGYGTMKHIWYNRLTAPLLKLGTSRHIMFPQGGRDIPFTIENYAYVDQFGRETVTWIRKFKFAGEIRHFDATMIFSRQRKRIVDYLGSKQHLAVDLHMEAAPNGGIRILSGEQRFYEGIIGFRLPRWLTGRAEVCEWYDDEQERFRISVNVMNPVIGPVFRYEGTFRVRTVDADRASIPVDAMPLREERRE